MTKQDQIQLAKDFDKIASEIKGKYGVGKFKKIDISQMTNEDLKRVFDVIGKFPMGYIDDAPFNTDFVIGVICEMHNRHIEI